MHRDLFAPSSEIYLLAHSIGKMPVSTIDYCQQHFFDIWHSNRDDIWPRWLAEIDAFKHALARLLNTSADAFCPQTNVSSALTKAIGALPKQSDQRNVILMTENDFPSAGFVLQQAEKLGFTVKMMDKSHDAQDPEAWSAAMNSDVHSVFITHVHYNTNKLIPVGDIAATARRRGITSIVDIAQSSGIVPIDLTDWNADIVVGSCIKWLCGGPGAGFLWVNPTLIESLEPVDVGWFSHHNPFEFDIHHFEYAPDSTRFWGGTPSILPFVAATNSINLLTDIGIDMIQRHNRALSTLITEQLPASYIASPLDTSMKGGTVVLQLPDNDRLVRRLSDREILFDAREYGIRLSPHIYNQTSEINELLDCLHNG